MSPAPLNPVPQVIPVTPADLLAPYTVSGPRVEKVGIEVEIGTLDAATGRSLPYHGPQGIRALLEALLADGGGTPLLDGENPIGLEREDGLKLTLEHGGAIEYCSPPATDLVDLATTLERRLGWIAGIAERFGAALVPGGNLPFNTVDDLHWVPKPRGLMMRQFFADLGDPGSLGADVMGLGLATQATLDYLSTADMVAKARMMLAATPVAGALFANSPIAGGRVSGSLSRRMEFWFRSDPARCGPLPFALGETFAPEDVVDWLLTLPMIYHKNAAGHYERAPNRPFSALLANGFDDGTFPILADWTSHQMQVWPDVRIRNTLEARVTDGPAFREIPAVPTFWTGLAYHPPSREAAWDLLRGASAEEYREAMRDAARQGLAASYRGQPVRELAAELLRLSREGIAARIAAGLDGPEALTYLDPLSEVVESGQTFAERVLKDWEVSLAKRPDRWVTAYRVPPSV